MAEITIADAVAKVGEMVKTNLPSSNRDEEELATVLMSNMDALASDSKATKDAADKITARLVAFVKGKAPEAGQAVIEDALPVLKSVTSNHPLKTSLITGIESLINLKVTNENL